MITAEQEKNLSDANARAKKKQDKANPMVININNGRLMPNTPRLRAHAQYKVYSGLLDASLPERMRWLEGSLKSGTKKIVNSKAEADMFDVGTADKDELIIFAMEEFGQALDPKLELKAMRKKIVAMDAARAASSTALVDEETELS